MVELNEDLIDKLIKIFPDCLDQIEKQVIEKRYCINGESKRTLQQIGDMLGVSRERVRQIERKALRKLKHPSRMKALTTSS